MALIGKLAVNLQANTNGLSAGLTKSAGMVDAWSSKVGSKVDTAFAGLASGGGKKGIGSLATNLEKISSASKKARTALDFADVGRYVGKAATGVAGLGLSFAGSGEKADTMRARVAKVSEALTTMGSASKKARTALLFTDAAVFLTKLGAVGGGALAAVGHGMVSVALGGVRAAAGVAAVGRGVAGVGRNSVQLTKSLGGLASNLGATGVAATKAVFGFGKSGDTAKAAGRSFLSAFSAFQSGAKLGANFAFVGAGLSTIFSGSIKAAGGVARLGGGLLKLGGSFAMAAVRGLAGIATGAFRLAASFASAAMSALKFASIGGLIVGALGLKAAGAAAHLSETIATTEQVFGKSADGIIKSAEKMNAAYGTNRKEFLEGANALGSQFQGAGYAEKDAAALSEQLLRLAGDANASRGPLGGFNEALGKIRSGLSGEAEPLKAWGISIDENSVKTQAMTMGLIKQGQELTNSQKVQARLALITKGLAKDQGTLAREAENPAAQMAEFWGRAQTVFETVGASLAPTVGKGLEVVNQILLMLSDSWSAMSETVAGFIGGVGSTLVSWAGAVSDFFELGANKTNLWQVSLGAIANAWQLVGIAFGAVKVVISAGLSAILGGLSYVGSGFDYLYTKITGESSGVGDYLDRLAKKMATSAGEGAQSLSEAWSQPWASATDAPQNLADALTGVATKVSGAYTAAGDKMKAIRAELAKPIVATIGKPNETALAKKAGAKHDPFAGASLAGSKDAASIVLRSRYGTSGKDGTAVNTKRSADSLARLEASQRETNRLLRDRVDGLAFGI